MPAFIILIMQSKLNIHILRDNILKMTDTDTVDRSRRYHQMVLLMVFSDIITIFISYCASLWIRFEFSISEIPLRYIDHMTHFLMVVIPAALILYYINRLYHSVWRFASITEVYRIAVTYIIIGILTICLNFFNYFFIPRSCLTIGYIFSLFFCVLIRFSNRFLHYFRARYASGEDYENVLLIGAGQAAREIIHDIRMGEHSQYRIRAIVDDSRLKQGRDLEGIRIEGGRNDIPDLVKKYDIKRIIFAITNISAHDRSEILNICKDTGCRLQIIPSLYGFYAGTMTVAKLRDVSLEDLLGRDEIKVNNDEIMNYLTGKTIMVTGAGGSIGSELSRQIAAASPKQLILFDIYENTTYEIQLELKKNYPHMDLVVLIGSVTDEDRVRSILTQYRPQIIYHAAAHKHVPLMEDSPNEAIKNNTLGTYTMARLADEAGVEHFLLISTDKAVNPTNIMGASKRLCEMIIQMMARKSTTTIYSAVRFGNVLGSNGSVIPLFKKQIAEGGPVTVTDKDIIRYFMTIPEAVSLVLQASYYARGGEIFVLDMGKPVKIDDMARNLIRLSGYEPDKDIQIVYTGLRPGEKLYEELLMDEEGMQKTGNDLIYIGHPISFDDAVFTHDLEMLQDLSYQNAGNIEQIVAGIVPTYHPARNGERA